MSQHPSSPGAERLLAEARSQFESLNPEEVSEALEDGALLIDIRPTEDRERDGTIAGAVVVERNVLEWRLDPEGAWRIPELVDPDQQVILFCNEGYASALAVPALIQLGLNFATDLDGGFHAWRNADLPFDEPELG